MVQIEDEPWAAMLDHARRCYPEECCGVMLGRREEGVKRVLEALPLENRYPGPRRSRYELHPQDLLRAERRARERNLELLGIYHSHPDCPAYFSQTDLENSCPWYSFVVLSICEGRFAGAGSWLPDAERSAAAQEELRHPESSYSENLCRKS